MKRLTLILIFLVIPFKLFSAPQFIEVELKTTNPIGYSHPIIIRVCSFLTII
ncbi:MAG: hypothetical protein ACP5QK_06325 [Myxococcota bacterium]